MIVTASKAVCASKVQLCLCCLFTSFVSYVPNPVHVPLAAAQPVHSHTALQVVSVKVPDPEFEGQTKTRLGNPEVKTATTRLVADSLEEFLRVNAPVLKVCSPVQCSLCCTGTT
jgi:DNA gyrase B